jgi:hypothetical protein
MSWNRGFFILVLATWFVSAATPADGQLQIGPIPGLTKPGTELPPYALPTLL